MRKDGGGGGATPSSPIPLPCFDLKPFVATLVVLGILMAFWQFQPYQPLLPSSNNLSTTNCSLLNSSTAATDGNSLATEKFSSSISCSTPLLNSTTAAASTDGNSLATEKFSSSISSSAPPLNSTAAAAATEKFSSSISSSAPSTAIITPSDPNKRVFLPHGSAAALFVQIGAYRGGPATFAIVGLASKPTHVFGKPWYKCEWVPDFPGRPRSRAKAFKMLPDWGYGRVYTVVVVNCTFPSNPNSDNSGGKLFLYAYYSPSPRKYEKFVALEEPPGSYDEARFRPPFQYEYLYCGSSLYGNLSASRIREWMAYHAHFFGRSSHFVFHDAGGVSPAVRAALEPWVRIGRATVQDIRAQGEYDGYYYNQFLVVNDCLHRYRHAANWTFFFDVDEYLYLPDGNTLETVLGKLAEYTQFTIEQNPMSSKLCVLDPKKDYSRVDLCDSSFTPILKFLNGIYSEWGFEKLVFRNSITGIRRDRKYAIQARNAFATGVHMSQNVIGKTTHKTESVIRYYHYHDSINVLGEPCRRFVSMPAKGSVTWFEKIPYVYDDNMTRLAPTIKQFEKQTIGPV
ncbi:Galactan beta-1,4-galactosyltransferase GALS1 [Cocos nucifera]|uniref:Glycosyltransferase family 92 protein n=1 Tax=Cocos nucifera TaxID=13894 RepID=A0A8K0MUB1_COCNU|nr:Galactan beta-1,4-galactosyltransferase GALS1 [Cocos nucifera]